MSSISKQQWKEIEQALSEMHVNVRFEYKGFELTVQRIRIKESKLALRVYINDELKGAWFTDVLDGKENEVSSIFKDVFKLCQKSIYTAADIKKVEKALGKRQSKQLYPNLHEKHSYWIPDFTKGSVLCRQYKKLEGLTLISI